MNAGLKRTIKRAESIRLANTCSRLTEGDTCTGSLKNCALAANPTSKNMLPESSAQWMELLRLIPAGSLKVFHMQSPLNLFLIVWESIYHYMSATLINPAIQMMPCK